MLKVKVKDIPKYVAIAYEAKKPLFLWGAPGIGKSTAIKDAAEMLSKKYNEEFGLIDIRLSQLDPTDLGGIPVPSEGRMGRLYPKWWPTEGRGLLFFDELNKGVPTTQASCFKGDAAVSVVGGIKKIGELEVGDKVIDMLGEEKRVTEVLSRKYDGVMRKVKGRCFMPFEATEEHPVFVIDSYLKENSKWKKKGKIGVPRWVVVKDLKEGQYVGMPILQPKYKDTHLTISTRGHIEKRIVLDEDLAEFLGWYVGDGYSSNGRIGICLGKHEVVAQARVSSLISKLFNKVSLKKPNDNMVDVGFCDESLIGWFKEACGKDVYEKKIPDFILRHEDVRLVKAFIRGYHGADGHSHVGKKYAGKSFVRFTTVSKTLALQLQQACSRLGFLPALSVRPAGTHFISGKEVNCREAYVLNSAVKEAFDACGVACPTKLRETYHYFFAHGAVWTKIDSISERKFKGDVFNCEVEGTHSYLVSNQIVHNCYQLILDRRMGDVPLGEGWIVVAAGNRATDRVVVYDMDSALQNRFALHIEVECPDGKDLVAYLDAKGKGDPQVGGFLEFRPSRVWRFEPKEGDPAWASPRTWEQFVDLKALAPKDMEKLAYGCLGDVTGREFVGWLRLADEVDIDKLLEDPEEQFNRITKPDVKHSVITEVADRLKGNPKVMEKCINLVFAVKEPEYVMLCLTQFNRANKSFVRKVMDDKRGSELASHITKFIC